MNETTKKKVNGHVIFDSYHGPSSPEILEKLPVKIVKKDFICSYFGRMHNPQIAENTIEIEAGIGYHSNKHFHTQNFAVLDVDATSILLQVRKGGDLYGHGVRHFIAGHDENQLFLHQVPSTTEKLAEAYDYIKPKAARKEGTLRQGDIYFIPRAEGKKAEKLSKKLGPPRNNRVTRDT